jgi:hypothetical protein
MKARFFKKVSWGLALSALPFLGACDQPVSNAPQPLIAAAQTEPLAVADANAVAPATTEPAPPAGAEAVPVPAPGAGKTLPPAIKPSSPVAEVVKLAQAGVDESVMLTYVTNSASLFNLSSDEIIYLNDLGVADSVVTAMMQHDQAIKQRGAEMAAAQPAAAPAGAPAAEAAAPSYVNPPSAEAQPAPTAEAAPTPPANVTYNYFYNSLSPYGTWIDVDGYGWCWQPTVVVVNSGWRPYCDRGRWLYTNLGWYWQSDYSWGWATFHYGRWFHHARWGWCWYPDYVWGPSWVTWRYGGGYCGWAPLPPAAYYRPGFGFYYHNRSVSVGFDFGLGAGAFTFVSWDNFCDRHPWRHRVPTTRVTQIYNNTTIVNNIVTGDHNRIINRGIPIERVREHTRAEIRQVTVRETPAAAGFAGRHERLERDGRTLVVERPKITSSPVRDTAPGARRANEARPGHTPTAGAAAAAQIELPRASGPARMSAEAREQFNRPQSGRVPTPSREPAEHRARMPAPTPGADTIRSAPPAVRPSPAPGPRSSATVEAPAAPKSSPNLIVIGRRDDRSGRVGETTVEPRANPVRTETSSRPTHNWTAPRATPPAAAPRFAPTPQTRAATPPPTLSFNESPAPAPRFERSAPTRNFDPPGRAYPAPAPAAPPPRPQFNAPRFSEPRSMPAPSYSAPRSAPAPAYTPAPSRAPSGPSSSPGRSEGGRHGSGRRE